MDYRNDSTFLDRQVWTNSVDPDQSKLFAIPSAPFGRMIHHSVVKPWFTASAFCKLPSIYVFSYFPFGFEGRMWDPIVSVPDYCLSFYFVQIKSTAIFLGVRIFRICMVHQ